MFEGASSGRSPGVCARKSLPFGQLFQRGLTPQRFDKICKRVFRNLEKMYAGLPWHDFFHTSASERKWQTIYAVSLSCLFLVSMSGLTPFASVTSLLSSLILLFFANPCQYLFLFTIFPNLCSEKSPVRSTYRKVTPTQWETILTI